MKVVVIGGTGLIGSTVVGRLGEQGHETVAASPRTGVNSLTGDGLDAAVRGAAVVVDVSNSPSFADDDVMDFFRTSTTNLLTASEKAGVGHYVALSVVGTDRLPESGYLRAKLAQEQLIEGSTLPYSIVHATQFFEFASGIADSATVDGAVRLPNAGVQPMAAREVAAVVARTAAAAAAGGGIEIGGPEVFGMDEWIRTALTARSDPRPVVADPQARYFGAVPGPDSLLPGAQAERSAETLTQWLAARVSDN